MDGHRIKVVLVGLAFVATACAVSPRPSVGDGTGSCPVFPADSVWNATVSALPLNASSAAWVSSIGAGSHVHADFGSGTWDGGPIGIPWTTVGAGQATVPVDFDYDDESDPGPYPYPADAPVEWGSDHHVIVVDTAACRLYETFDSTRRSDGSWHAGSGATWDLRSNALRPAGWTSADAAGLPILPGLVRYSEVAAGHIDHMVRFTAPRTQRAYLWPARHFASSSTDPNLPPMGAVFRLKAGTDLSRLGPQARVVARAMQTHGMILADNGSSWYVSGAPDAGWDNDDLHTLGLLSGADFEAVDTSGLMADSGSGRMR